MFSCTRSIWPPRLVTVPGLHGSEGAHWQTWLERQFPRALRVEQTDWDAPDLAIWAQAVEFSRIDPLESLLQPQRRGDMLHH